MLFVPRFLHFVPPPRFLPRCALSQKPWKAAGKPEEEREKKQRVLILADLSIVGEIPHWFFQLREVVISIPWFELLRSVSHRKVGTLSPLLELDGFCLFGDFFFFFQKRMSCWTVEGSRIPILVEIYFFCWVILPWNVGALSLFLIRKIWISPVLVNFGGLFWFAKNKMIQIEFLVSKKFY